MKEKIKREFKELVILLRSVPSIVLTLFAITVFSMNLLANKSIDLGVDWIALDCGMLLSWLSFLSMDILTKHFGPKASTQISVLALLLNLFFCLIFFLASLIPGVWSQSFVEGSESVIIDALNKTFSGSWYVLLGSSVAFLVSSIANNATNWLIGKRFIKNPDSTIAFIARSYLSTAVGQLLDNLVFAFMVSYSFFGWSILQCVMCAMTGMLLELLFEIIFSPIGIAICKKWKKDGIGREYFEFRNKELEYASIDKRNE